MGPLWRGDDPDSAGRAGFSASWAVHGDLPFRYFHDSLIGGGSICVAIFL